MKSYAKSQPAKEMGDGRWKREALSYTELRGKIEEGRRKQLHPLGKKREGSRQKREKNNLAGIL